MHTRPWARGHEETPTANRRGLLGIGTTHKVTRQVAGVKGSPFCRVSIPSCPDLRPRPQITAKPLLQPCNRTEVGEHLPVKRALDGLAAHPSLALHGPQRESVTLIEGSPQSLHELLSVDRRDRRALLQPSSRPRPPRNVLPWCGVTSGPGHGYSLGQQQACPVSLRLYYSGHGSYKTHHRLGAWVCRSIASSEVAS